MKQTIFLAGLFLFSVLVGASHGQNSPPEDRNDAKAPSQPQELRDLVTKAQSEEKKGNLELAITLTEEALRVKPDDRETLFYLARLMWHRGMQLIEAKKTHEGYALFIVAAQRMRELNKKHMELTSEEQRFFHTVLYNAACAYSLRGKTKQALHLLEDAFEAGFRDIDLLTSDVDLEAVRALPEFKTLLQQQLKRPAIAAEWFNQRGVQLFRQGKYPQSIEVFKQALEACRQLYPESEHPLGHSNLATSLLNLGKLLELQGEYGEARSFLRQALQMNRRLYPEEKYPEGHFSLAESLNSLGGLLLAQGEYSEAQTYSHKALEMYQRLYPKEKLPQGHLRLALCLSDLGGAFKYQGEYGQARRYFQRALQMARQLYPEQQYPRGNPNLAGCLNNLGLLLKSQGEYGEARGYCEQALDMYRKLYPEEEYPKGHLSLAGGLNNLGGLLLAQSEYSAASRYHQQALEMFQRLYPQEEYPLGHPDLAVSLSNVGASLQSLAQYGEARRYKQRALEMKQRLYRVEKYPQGHPALSLSLTNMGYLLYFQGEYSEACKYVERALEMDRRLYPEHKYPLGHPDLATSLQNLGFLLAANGEYSEARSHSADAISMCQNMAELFSATASEAEALNFFSELTQARDLLVSIWWELDDSADELYAFLWRGRRVVQRIIRGRQQALASLDDPKVQVQYREYLDTRRALARLSLAPAEPDLKRSAARMERLSELTTRKEGLERDLADNVPEFRRQLAGDRGTHFELAEHLPPQTVFIDLFGYMRDKRHPDRPTMQENGTRSYVAFLQRRGKPVVRVDLRSASPIDAAVAAWRQDITAGKKSSAADELRRLVWEPIAKELPEALDQVFLCPDGVLTAVPWAALPGRKPGTVLLEEYALALVPHGQFLLSALKDPSAADSPQGHVLTVGNVSYDSRHIQTAPGAVRLATRSAVRGEEEAHWTPLPGTAKELSELLAAAGTRSVLQLVGGEANTARILEELPGCRWAHLATHGFFADAKFRSALQLDETAFRRQPFAVMGERTAVIGRNPLVLSGLVLAGANLPRPTDEFGIPLGDGGILTAEAIAGLPLQDLDMVVLSACETGLGQVAGGEGVFGLQRAFHMAGALTTVASLWKVDDVATQALMIEFYKNLWQKKLGKLESLRQAQLALRNGKLDTQMESLSRALGKPSKLKPGKPATHRDPRLWAAFVLSGDWR